MLVGFRVWPLVEEISREKYDITSVIESRCSVKFRVVDSSSQANI